MAEQLRSELKFQGSTLQVRGLPFGRGWELWAGETYVAELKRRRQAGRHVLHLEVGSLTVSVGSLAEAAELAEAEASRRRRPASAGP